MQPFFTIHAGEYLVGSHIESQFKNINVWVPSKDKGIDLLLTNSDNSATVSIQVKFSKDFLITHMDESFQKGLRACGWWSLNREKIQESIADYWVLALHRFNAKELQFIIIKPKELLEIYDSLERSGNRIQSYIWITEKNKAWEARGLKKPDQILIANHAFTNSKRDLSSYLNNWSCITNMLK